MDSPLPPQISGEQENVEATIALAKDPEEEEDEEEVGHSNFSCSPLQWFKMLAREMHWSFVYGVVTVYGISQGLGGAISRVSSDYYWKDVQKVKPSAAQAYDGISNLPWIIKPLWGILTDVLPIAGYHRRPYFILAGLLGVISMLTLCLHSNLHVIFALLAMTVGKGSAAIADVTIDACVAQNSIKHPSLAADMQSLCGLSTSIGRIIGFSLSGLLVHAIGSQGVLGLLSIPSALVLSVGIMLKEIHLSDFDYGQIHQKFQQVSRSMWTTLRCPEVWRPCAYMYISLSLSLKIEEGMFYWYTDPKSGPSFSQEAIGFIFSIGSVGYILAVLLYQNMLKNFPFRSLLFWSQLLTAFAGMMDLILVLRLNLKLGIPDYFFAVIDESVFQMVNNLKWMSLLVMSAKLCPPGIEGTFFALLMSIDSTGLLTASWGGGLVLHLLKVTRTEFDNLWAAILVRNIMRVLPLIFLFLVPKSDQNSTLLPANMLNRNKGNDYDEALEGQVNDIEMVALIQTS